MSTSISPLEWLNRGGGVDDAILRDADWKAKLEELLSQPSNAFRVCNAPAKYEGGLRMLGLSFQDLKSTVRLRLESESERALVESGEDAFCKVVIDVVSALFGEDPSRAAAIAPMLSGGDRERLTHALLEGDFASFLEVQPLEWLVELLNPDLNQDGRRGHSSDPRLDNAALIGSCVRACLQGATPSATGRLILAGLVLIRGTEGWVRDELLQSLGFGAVFLERIYAKIAKEGDIGVFVDSGLSEAEIISRLERCSEAREVLEAIGFPINVEDVRIREQLRNRPHLADKNLWARMTIEQIVNQGASGELGLDVLNGRAVMSSIKLDSGGSRAIECDALWERSSLAEAWIRECGAAAPVLEVAREEIAKLASDASLMGKIRLALAYTCIKEGFEVARNASIELGLPDGEERAAFRDYLEFDQGAFRADNEALYGTKLAEFLLLGPDGLKRRLQFWDSEVVNCVCGGFATLATSRLKNAIPSNRAWLPGFVLSVTRNEKELQGLIPASSSVRIEALLSSMAAANPEPFASLTVDDQLALAEAAGECGCDSMADLCEALDCQASKIREGWSWSKDEFARLDEELDACQAAVVSGGDGPQGSVPELVDALRHGDPAPFKKALRAEAGGDSDEWPTESSASAVAHKALSREGLTTGLVATVAVWIVWTYGIVSDQVRGQPSLESTVTSDMDVAKYFQERHGMEPAHTEREGLWVMPTLLQWEKFCSIREELAKPDDLGTARVSFFEATQWCEDFGEVVEAELCSQFPGRIWSVTGRLPRAEEIEYGQQENLAKSYSTGEWEWLNQRTPPKAFGDTVTVSGTNGSALTHDSNGSFRVVIEVSSSQGGR